MSAEKRRSAYLDQNKKWRQVTIQEDRIFCECGQRAARHRSRQARSLDKWFYTCPGGKTCKPFPDSNKYFFVWEEDLVRSGLLEPSTESGDEDVTQSSHYNYTPRRGPFSLYKSPASPYSTIAEAGSLATASDETRRHRDRREREYALRAPISVFQCSESAVGNDNLGDNSNSSAEPSTNAPFFVDLDNGDDDDASYRAPTMTHASDTDTESEDGNRRSRPSTSRSSPLHLRPLPPTRYDVPTEGDHRYTESYLPTPPSINRAFSSTSTRPHPSTQRRRLRKNVPTSSKKHRPEVIVDDESEVEGLSDTLSEVDYEKELQNLEIHVKGLLDAAQTMMTHIRELKGKHMMRGVKNHPSKRRKFN